MKISAKKSDRINAQASTINDIDNIVKQAYNELLPKKHGKLHVTTPTEGQKLDGLLGIGTPCTTNRYCILRREKALKEGDTSCICLGCYADGQCNRYTSMEQALMYNQYILCNQELQYHDIAGLDLYREYIRLEMHGDVNSVQQCINYIRIAEAWPTKKFAVWSKNLGLWLQAFERVGKPLNLVFVQSSVHIDKVDTTPLKMGKYVDYIFTVCSSKDTLQAFLSEYNGSCRCNGVSCKDCLHCYEAGNNRFIFELLR